MASTGFLLEIQLTKNSGGTSSHHKHWAHRAPQERLPPTQGLIHNSIVNTGRQVSLGQYSHVWLGFTSVPQSVSLILGIVLDG